MTNHRPYERAGDRGRTGDVQLGCPHMYARRGPFLGFRGLICGVRASRCPRMLGRTVTRNCHPPSSCLTSERGADHIALRGNAQNTS